MRGGQPCYGSSWSVRPLSWSRDTTVISRASNQHPSRDANTNATGREEGKIHPKNHGR